ncbi:MAG TPA: hypothetical protein VJM50_13015 [Pyrinomonadaceae bacterium]|nr:hypothetical protein [Pyrinomonadaceae bacterium]
MSDEELELLITLDDPVEAPEEDFFHHPETTNIEVHTMTPQKNGEIVE